MKAVLHAVRLKKDRKWNLKTNVIELLNYVKLPGKEVNISRAADDACTGREA